MEATLNEHLHRLQVVVPAYDNVLYLTRCLSSITEQTYPLIDVLVSDDASPHSLEGAVADHSEAPNQNVQISFHRNDSNLGPFANLVTSLGRASSKGFLVCGPHDDWWTDTNFFEQVVAIFQEKPTVGVVIANSAVEHPSGYDTLQMNYWAPAHEWRVIDGHSFVRDFLFQRLHPAYSAVVLNLAVLDFGMYLAFLKRLERAASSADVDTDEGFAGIILAALNGDVAVSSRVVSTRGRPPGSYSQSRRWQRLGNLGMFLNFSLMHDLLVDLGESDMSEFVTQLMKNRYSPMFLHWNLLRWLYWNCRWSVRMYLASVLVNYPKYIRIRARSLVIAGFRRFRNAAG